MLFIKCNQGLVGSLKGLLLWLKGLISMEVAMVHIVFLEKPAQPNAPNPQP